MNDIIRPTQPQQSNQPPRPSGLPPVVPSSVSPSVNPPPNPQPTESTTSKPILEPPKKRWLKWVLIIVATLVVALAATGVAGFMWYQGSLSPRSSEMKNTHFTVESGATVESVTADLAEADLVQNGLAAQIYMRLNSKTDIKVGTYLLSPNQSVAEIVDWLNEGRVNTLKVTILPGRTIQEIKKDLIKYDFNESSIDEALAATYDHPLFEGKPAGTSLEGYIFPETFFVTSTTTPTELFKLSFDEFEKRIEAGGIRELLAKQNLNLYEGITLASIISSEVPDVDDRHKVAQVFLKRLSIEMPLGSDVTYIYAAKQLGVEPTPDLDSPYNTRKVLGLPPGPISNFNLTALDAVVAPASTTFLYFVSGDDGITYFAHTLEEHEDNVSKHCQRLCN